MAFNKIVSKQRKMRVVAFTANAAGTALTGPDSLIVTMVDTGTGIKTITLNQPFADANYQVILTSGTTAVVQEASITSKSVFVINGFDNAVGTTATDGIVHVLVIGSDTVDKF